MAVLAMTLFVGVGAFLAQPAAAQSVDPYVGPTTIVSPTEPPASVNPTTAAQVDPAAQVAPATQSQGTLPVTGSDVGGLVAIAAGLILIGGVALAVRRRLEPAQA
jgi:LPXTG-motif cell wall-anchored protein